MQWRERRIHLEPAAGAAEAAVAFECVNRGTTPIRIIDVRSGCGCTVTGMDKDVIPPGERGFLHAVYEIGERQGRQTVAITVTAAEPAVVRHDLTLEVTIKEFVTVNPRALVWRLGEEATTKIFQVQPAAGFEFVGVESPGGEFVAEVAGREGGAIQLRVTPRDTWARRNAAIKILLAQDRKPPVAYSVKVQVN